MNVGLPELTVVLLVSALLLIPLGAVMWALVTWNRIRVTQEAMRHKLDAIARSLEDEAERARPVRQEATEAEGRSDLAVCVWCGRPVAEDEAFMLRVGARLCPSCAEDAGRIAAEQRLGKGPSRPPGDK
jgi:succinate dehydrogenase/fumarate reductase-like Fe-S protein